MKSSSLANGAILVDLEFSTRLEMTEALANARFIEARRRVEPDSQATWIEVAGANVLFDFDDSPLTQSFGLGLQSIPNEDQWQEIENFYFERRCPVNLEISPIVSQEILSVLAHRGYRPIELTNVLYRSLEDVHPPSLSSPSPFDIQSIEESEAEAWAQLAADGWNAPPEIDRFIRQFGQVAARTDGNRALMVRWNERPIATGAIFIEGGVGLLAGASTLPEARNRGAQAALFEARLRLAKESGCDIAMMCAQPGTSSQKNAQRKGFHIAYTRIKWQLTAGHSER